MFSEEDDLGLEESKGPPIQEGPLDSSELTEEESELERARDEYYSWRDSLRSRYASAIREALKPELCTRTGPERWSRSADAVCV
jgi:hypothetical protein